MGWKNIKDHYRIGHIVAIYGEKGICIGSQYVHDLLMVGSDGTHSKLWGWAEYVKDYGLVVFDEMQELRIDGSRKYAAAARICAVTPHRIGLTATPVYNYGNEMFNLMDLLSKGCLGRRGEFYREWCMPFGNHQKVTDPSALGSHLAESHLFLRRRRHEVGRELPPVTTVAEEVEYNNEALLANEDKALELAKAVLRGSWSERGKAALELDAMLRMQTGIAKAPFVADFVRELVESGESVVLAGWHREVYTVWQRAFERECISSRLYTGSESPSQKADAVRAFATGQAKVFILSLPQLGGAQRAAGHKQRHCLRRTGLVADGPPAMYRKTQPRRAGEPGHGGLPVFRWRERSCHSPDARNQEIPERWHHQPAGTSRCGIRRTGHGPARHHFGKTDFGPSQGGRHGGFIK